MPEVQPGATGVAPFYISTVSAGAGRDPVLKTGDAFAIFDDSGDIQAAGSALQGVLFEDTRYLSRLALTIENERPLLLSSNLRVETATLESDLTNCDVYDGDTLKLARDSVHIRKTLLLGSGALFMSLELTNFAAAPCVVHLDLGYAADFVDLFELRGSKRPRHGDVLPAEIGPDHVVLGYRGLDAVERRTRLEFDPTPAAIESDGARWRFDMGVGERATLEIAIHFVPGGAQDATTLADTRAAVNRRHAEREKNAAQLESGNEVFDEWLGRSREDLLMLITDTPEGPYPYAGIPWFSTAFGRDGMITALECLWLDPEITAGTLRFLAARQATEVDPKADSEPGKILHETRKGEMAALGEIPYGRYYGSVDSTPLFIILADAYHARTGDLALIKDLWPNIEAALGWIEKYGDADHDGFVEYGHQAHGGLANQGWKDTGDAIFHRDGALAKGPIALVEVQAYVYAAYLGAARLARLVDKAPRAMALERAAAELKRRFEPAFWCEELGTFALALDGDKKQCQVRASNPGHVLFGGLADDRRAKQVAELLMRPEFFSEWGIRTLADGEPRFNPMSYHNGSVWPHDNALIGLGLAKYGLKAPLLRILTGMFGASSYASLHRLPELFCGFPRRDGVGPVAYPVACSPQAWASASVFALLGAAFGIGFDADAGRIRFDSPVLPPWLPRLRISNLRLGDAVADLVLERRDDSVEVQVSRRQGRIEVVKSA